MQNRRRSSSTLFAAILAAASLGATAAPAQTSGGSGDPANPPTYCYSAEGNYWYVCCNRSDPCTQIFVDASLPPVKPADLPDE